MRAECAADWQQEHRTSTKTENGVAWDHPLGGVLAHPSPHNRPDPVTLPQNFSYLHNFSFVVTVGPPPPKEKSDLVPSHNTKAVTHIPRQYQE